MRHIMVMNAKGGCGKSTLATNIASYFADEGYSVGLADYDPQRSSIDWLERRPDKRPEIAAIEAYKDGLRYAPRSLDYLIIDAPARIGASISIVAASDPAPTAWSGPEPPGCCPPRWAASRSWSWRENSRAHTAAARDERDSGLDALHEGRDLRVGGEQALDERRDAVLGELGRHQVDHQLARADALAQHEVAQEPAVSYRFGCCTPASVRCAG